MSSVSRYLPPSTAIAPPLPDLEGKSRLAAYRFVALLGKGTFAEVAKYEVVPAEEAAALAGPSAARGLAAREEPSFVAIKSVNRLSYRSGANLGAVKELQAIQEARPHRNVVRLLETFAFGDRVHLVLEFCASDLARTLRDRSLALGEAHVKGFLQQILAGVAHVHACGLLHRDLKPDNVLLTADGVVKLADFGHAGPQIDERDFDGLVGAGTGGGPAAMDEGGAGEGSGGAPSPLSVAAAALGATGASLLAPRSYFYRVVTLWYRAPELLLGARYYTPAVDMWAVGAILAELLLRQVLFPAQPQRPEVEEREQLAQIFRVMGTPIDPLVDPQAAAAAYAAAGISVEGGASATVEAAGGAGASSSSSSSTSSSSSSSSSSSPSSTSSANLSALPPARPRPLAANLPVWPGCASLPGACAFEPRRPQPWRKVFPLEAGNPPSFQGPGASALALDLLSQLLVFDPARRLSATEALRHPWFAEEPLPAPASRLPVSAARPR